MNKERLEYLLNRLQQGTLSIGERKELHAWDSSLERDEPFIELYGDDEQQLLRQKLWEQIDQRTTGRNKLTAVPSEEHKVFHLNRIWWKAAVVLVILSVSIFYFWEPQKQALPKLVSRPQPPPQKDVMPPSSNHATLTLSGGQQISLQAISNGTIATQASINIQKLDDGRIVYQGNTASQEVLYNTLEVPRGSQIASIVLADGTRVFLNASSSITYPVVFNTSERRVQLTGEAYFEVAKDPSKKFIVNSNGVTTEVLGTHFNVNTYAEEMATRVTLLEGSVKVKGAGDSVTIRPGSQAVVEQEKMNVKLNVDVDQVMAWKNGVFNFNNADFMTVMRQLSRWYDIEIVYPQGVPVMQFGGEIQKTLSLSEMLDALGAVDVKFEIKDKQLIVLP